MPVFDTWVTDGSGKPFYVRKIIRLKSAVKKAEALVCGLGQFNFYVNGKQASDHRLDPAWTDYRKLVDYVSFDITDMVKEGENVFAAEVGNGWYCLDTSEGYRISMPHGEGNNTYTPFGDAPVFAAVVNVTYEDGSEMTFKADGGCLTAPHPVCMSNAFGSEVTDGSKAIDHWNDIQCDESRFERALVVNKDQMPKGKQVLQTIPAVRVIREYEGKLIGKVNGRLIYDFGQNISGMLKCDIRGNMGSAAVFYPAEKLKEDGDVDQFAKNWAEINVFEKYIFGKQKKWEPFRMAFTYFGGRYVAVEGVEEEDIRGLTAEALSSAGEQAGTFECDDDRFMKIYDLVEKAVEANMMGVHTDCPTIEKTAWQEENVMMAPSVMYMKKVDLHWKKFLEDARAAQHKGTDFFPDGKGGKYYPGDGLIPSQAPAYMPMVNPTPMGSFYDIIPWGSSIVMGTCCHYMFYGDQKIISDNYEAAKHYMNHLETKASSTGFICHGLGDWGNPNPDNFARENVETAFFYKDYAIMGFFAEKLGLLTDSFRFKMRAESIKEFYNRILLRKNPKTGRYGYTVHSVIRPGEDNFYTTQGSLALPLMFGLVPKEHEADVVETFREQMIADNAIISGEVCHPFIIQAMAKYGMNDLLCDFILRDQHPSYYAFVKAGETTLGEFWEDNPRSHNHDMMGHIIEWYYNGLAGINPIEPGFKKTMITPYLPKSMNHMKCTHETPYGTITVEMTRKDGKVELEVNAPDTIQLVIDRSALD